MFGFFKKIKEARAVQKELTAVFKARGRNFMELDNTVHEAMVKEALVRGVPATIEHFDRIVRWSFGREDITEQYKKRSKEFD